MKKGDLVRVKAQVVTRFPNIWTGGTLVHEPKRGQATSKKCLYRLDFEPWTGMIVGKSYLATGLYEQAGDYWDGNYASLKEDKRHAVWLVEPIDSNRWVKPFACLEVDLELVKPNPTPDR